MTAQTDREALVALYRATDGDNWTSRENWNVGDDLSQWFGIETNDDDGRVVGLKLPSNNLEGSIPEALGVLSELKELSLASNRLTCSIPPKLGKLAALDHLNISHNQLTGAIPKELGDLTELKELWLGFNQLTGKIPASLGQLENLQQLILTRNGLIGRIPKSLGTLRELRVLWLSYNHLTGPIPQELGKLGALTHLHLEHNRLRGPIPEALGGLSNLYALHLEGTKHKLDGPIPGKLRNHPNFQHFKIGLALDGPPLPSVKSGWVLILPVLLGYADLASDLNTAVSYYKSGHVDWFVLGLIFALGPPVIMSAFYLDGYDLHRRVFVATQLSLLFEAFVTLDDYYFSPVLALVRVVEPLFESVPQLLLQLYAMLSLWGQTSSSGGLGSPVVSVCISAASLAYTITDISSVESLKQHGERGSSQRCRLCPCCPWSLTDKLFSRVPEKSSSSMRGLGEVHARTHVWFCFVYHVLEIVCRFLPLVMLLLLIRWWFVLVLAYLWIARGVVVRWSDPEAVRDPEAVWDFRFRVRLVAMPFLDSIMDGAAAFKAGFVLTLVESIVFMAFYLKFSHDDLSGSVRLMLTAVTAGCILGKMLLAWVAILPLKEKDSDGAAGQDETGGEEAEVDMTGVEDGTANAEVKEESTLSELAPSEGRRRDVAAVEDETGGLAAKVDMTGRVEDGTADAEVKEESTLSELAPSESRRRDVAAVEDETGGVAAEVDMTGVEDGTADAEVKQASTLSELAPSEGRRRDVAAVEDETGGVAAEVDMTGVEDGTANAEVKEESTLSELAPSEGRRRDVAAVEDETGGVAAEVDMTGVKDGTANAEVKEESTLSELAPSEGRRRDVVTVEDETGGVAAVDMTGGVEDGTANAEVKEASTLSELAPPEGTNVPPATNDRSAGSVSGESKGEENEAIRSTL